jgi:hypothetical protein
VSDRSPGRFATAAAVGSAVLVAPAVVFFGAATGRLLQPPNREPAHFAGAVFDWFVSLPEYAAALVLLAAPAAALLLGGLVLWRSLADDEALCADVRELGRVVLRILRRPAAWLSALVVLTSAGILFFLGWHAIVG